MQSNLRPILAVSVQVDGSTEILSVSEELTDESISYLGVHEPQGIGDRWFVTAFYASGRFVSFYDFTNIEGLSVVEKVQTRSFEAVAKDVESLLSKVGK